MFLHIQKGPSGQAQADKSYPVSLMALAAAVTMASGSLVFQALAIFKLA